MSENNVEKQYVIYDANFRLEKNGTLNGKQPETGEAVEAAIKAQKESFCRNFFEQNSFKHIVVLSGAGTSMGDVDLVKEGKDRKGLWTACEDTIKDICEIIKEKSSSCKAAIGDNDIEGFLSYVERYASVVVGGPDEERLKGLIGNLKTAIRENCLLNFKEKKEPHLGFLRKLIARKANLPRVEVFTTNYDTLFEQAAKSANIVVIDGFSFSMPREFAGRNFDLDIVNRARSRIKGEENFIPNVIHLFKLHGSVDWVMDEKRNVVVQRDPEDNDNALMVYPSADKYAASYDQPYFEMMSRFQTAVRRDELLLIVVGFGFRDKHINNVVVEAAKQNPSCHLLIVDYSGKNNPISLRDYEEIFNGLGSNISIFNGTFGEFVECMPLNGAYKFDMNGEAAEAGNVR